MPKDSSTLIDVKIKRITEKAFFVETSTHDGKMTEIWIPKSTVIDTDCFAEGDEGEMDIKMWIAVKNDLVLEEDN